MRKIELTEKQAALMWQTGPEGFEFLEKIKAILEPNEEILGLGSLGATDPLAQIILLIGEKKDAG